MTKAAAEHGPHEPGVTGAREAGGPKAFAHLRVLDLSEKLSGAYAARMFADFGADVILAEPHEGHPLRDEPPFVDDRSGLDRSVMHGYANWNKRSVVVRDAHAVARLAETADVLVTNAIRPWPDTIARAVDALSAGAIHLSITPHGLDGPLSGVCGNNLTACARTGWCTINRLVDEVPLQLPVRQTGYIAGAAGFVAAAAALWRRERTGAGERVDVSEVEALALTNAPWAMLGLFVGGHRMEYGPNGARYRGEPAPLWQAANGPMNLSFGDWGLWEEALRFLGLDELAEDEFYLPRAGRNTRNPKPVRAALAGAVATRDKWEVFHELARLRCPSGVVQDAQELAESEQSRAREFIVSARVGGRDVRATGAPVRLSETPWRLWRPAPGLDEHGDEIRKERRRPATRPARGPAARSRDGAANGVARAGVHPGMGRHIRHGAVGAPGCRCRTGRVAHTTRYMARRGRAGASRGAQAGYRTEPAQHQRPVQLGEHEQARHDIGHEASPGQGDLLAPGAEVRCPRPTTSAPT